MKNKRLLYIFAALHLLWLAGCDKNEELPVDTAPQEIVFDMLFSDDNPSTTRVNTNLDFTSWWENGDKIGIYIIKGQGTLLASGNHADNVEFTYSNGTWTTATPQYYPNDGDNLSFYAYYPYDASMVNPNAYAFNMPIDQEFNGAEYYRKNDFLWAKLENVTKSGNAVSLQFSHALAMIQFVIRYSEVQPLSIYLKEAVTDYTINMSTHNISPGNTKNDIKMRHRLIHSSVNISYTYWAIMPPQTMDVRFVWNWKGVYYSATPATNVTLASGKVNKYEIQ